MDGTERVAMAAIGGALALYGWQQRAKHRTSTDLLDKSIAGSEGWLGLGLGGMLLLVAFFG